MRQGLALLINQQQDMQVCGEAEEAQAAMHAIAQLHPDIMILDISLNGPDGLEILKNIRASNPDLPVLILSMHDEAIYAERALRARANGYIMKQEATEKVLVAVRRILNGEVYLSERMSNKMLQQYIGGAPSHDPVPHRLALRSRTRSLSPDRRRTRHPRDRRRTPSQHKDRGNLPGPHQGETRSAQRPRTDPARDSVEDQRITCLFSDPMVHPDHQGRQ